MPDNPAGVTGPAGIAGRIIVAGDVVDDIVVVPDGEIRRDTDTKSSIRFRAGGSAANTAAWLGSLGASVDFVGSVGADDVARHTARLAEDGVRAHLVGHPSLPTSTIIVLVEGQQRAMLTERGANAAFDPGSVTDELLDGAAFLHLTGYSVFGRDDPAAFVDLIDRAHARGVGVSFDPGSAGYIADYGVEKFTAVFGGVDILFPSLEEGRVLTGLDDPEAIATTLTAHAALVVLTMGVEGIIIARRGSDIERVAPIPADVVDPTGAGDAFTAGFLHVWSTTPAAADAARAGAHTASRSVTRTGGRP